jgi:hypothetical protein
VCGFVVVRAVVMCLVASVCVVRACVCAHACARTETTQSHSHKAFLRHTPAVPFFDSFSVLDPVHNRGELSKDGTQFTQDGFVSGYKVLCRKWKWEEWVRCSSFVDRVSGSATDLQRNNFDCGQLHALETDQVDKEIQSLVFSLLVSSLVTPTSTPTHSHSFSHTWHEAARC